MKPKGLNATDKMREWDRRQRDNKKYRNQNCAKFGEQTITIIKQRDKARKDARERYRIACAQQQIREKGKVFILDIDTRQMRLDE
jgi:hypothetical protein